ncbi:hypothetical protein DIZ81_07305 [Legionella taurinensis]|uniref:Uncharacterized protein n=1 Tax=Legionella taurinensis TaxID=70611 RepID=A0AB38N752_9GAMM|nr:hypothetical protein DB744_07305 [Legionella taurinensis]PUT40512.1 hypothetical protein DB746_11535 [Legionella taurinensis]PUT42757.1 hypothetical protein DB743_12020 [Legionella taurinensis]PUT48458.1 hypothetical protein DB745_05705 [Legionella taurinensis]TID31872.1 hypothetical protein DIZ41_12020 [Legionella taurinensis]
MALAFPCIDEIPSLFKLHRHFLQNRFVYLLFIMNKLNEQKNQLKTIRLINQQKGFIAGP